MKEAVESILNQTFRDFELIIIDDGSIDNTAEILDSFQDSRIVKLRNDKNQGLITSLNKGLSIAKGMYIARMDADDISLPDRIKKQVEFLDQNPDIGVLGTGMDQISESGQHISKLIPFSEHGLILWTILFETPIFHATTMFRKDKIIKIGGYSQDFIHAEDTELWSRMLFITKFANLPEVLYKRRLHQQSIMNTQFVIQNKANIVIRQKFISCLLGKFVSGKIIKCYLGHGVILNTSERLEAQSILEQYYNKITDIKDTPDEIRRDLHKSLLSKQSLIDNYNKHFFPKIFISYSRYLITAPVRHRLKSFLENVRK